MSFLKTCRKLKILKSNKDIFFASMAYKAKEERMSYLLFKNQYKTYFQSHRKFEGNIKPYIFRPDLLKIKPYITESDFLILINEVELKKDLLRKIKIDVTHSNIIAVDESTANIGVKNKILEIKRKSEEYKDKAFFHLSKIYEPQNNKKIFINVNSLKSTMENKGKYTNVFIFYITAILFFLDKWHTILFKANEGNKTKEKKVSVDFSDYYFNYTIDLFSFIVKYSDMGEIKIKRGVRKLDINTIMNDMVEDFIAFIKDKIDNNAVIDDYVKRFLQNIAKHALVVYVTFYIKSFVDINFILKAQQMPRKIQIPVYYTQNEIKVKFIQRLSDARLAEVKFVKTINESYWSYEFLENINVGETYIVTKDKNIKQIKDVFKLDAKEDEFAITYLEQTKDKGKKLLVTTFFGLGYLVRFMKILFDASADEVYKEVFSWEEPYQM